MLRFRSIFSQILTQHLTQKIVKIKFHHKNMRTLNPTLKSMSLQKSDFCLHPSSPNKMIYWNNNQSQDSWTVDIYTQSSNFESIVVFGKITHCIWASMLLWNHFSSFLSSRLYSRGSTSKNVGCLSKNAYCLIFLTNLWISVKLTVSFLIFQLPVIFLVYSEKE